MMKGKIEKGRLQDSLSLQYNNESDGKMGRIGIERGLLETDANGRPNSMEVEAGSDH